ncbi:hypothetical protein, partial [Ferruginibacter sp.]|uniref:hypothetical protein n=1 Tax=Ferruginibacter sp. TaxID=1940288 RepID=UPI00374D4E7F
MSKKNNYIPVIAALLVLITGVMSCTSTKKVTYFNDLKESNTGSLGTAQINFENPIQKNDQLWITVGGSNPLDLVALNS